jgi:hypothetical protein
MSYIIPIGPYHPALEEPVHAKLYTEGEEIKDAEVFIGYNHRGIEKLATQKNFVQTLVMVERVCGICSHSHALTYALSLENIAKMNVPKRGQYIRVIVAELERLHSHYLWLGIALHLIGHDSLFMHCWNDREMIMDILEEISGNRVNYGMVTIGGSRRDISDDTRKRVLEMLNKVWEQNKLVSQAFSAQVNETGAAAQRMNAHVDMLKFRIMSLEKQLFSHIALSFAGQDRGLYFDEGLDGNAVRILADTIADQVTGYAAVFSGDDGNGYSFCLVSRSRDLRDLCKEMTQALGGRGGGKPSFQQGRVNTSKEEIEAFFK